PGECNAVRIEGGEQRGRVRGPAGETEVRGRLVPRDGGAVQPLVVRPHPSFCDADSLALILDRGGRLGGGGGRAACRVLGRRGGALLVQGRDAALDILALAHGFRAPGEERGERRVERGDAPAARALTRGVSQVLGRGIAPAAVLRA